MESDASGVSNGMPAPYGRACTNCARAKCRCIYRPNGSGCERCHRLRKECVPSVTVRKRNGKRAHMSRTAQLEAKLEDLVTLLRHQTVPADKASSLGDTGSNVATSTPALSTHSTNSHSNHDSPRSVPAPVLPPQQPDCGSAKAGVGLPGRNSLPGAVFGPPIPTSLPAPIEPPPIPSCIYQPTPAEADEALMIFRKYMLIFLPFVHLPATVTSGKLRVSHPFLWFSIMTVTCKNVDRRLVMSEATKRFVAQKVVVDNEKSIDLLLGLLALLGWAHYHFKKDKPILCVFASLAKSLIFDMGLHKIPGEPHISACVKNYSANPPPKTLEERRAVLACFHLTSQIAYELKRLDPLNWTSYMEECLEELSQQREWEGDDLLVAQVKVQLIFDHLTRAASQSPDGIPPGYVLFSLRSQLQAIRAQLPTHLQHNDTILSHIFYADLAIHEVATNKPKASPGGIVSEMQRFEAMEACMSATQGWFDRHFSIPSYVYIGMTFQYWCNMAHCALWLAKLSILDEPGWDRRAVRSRIDVVAVLDRLAARFDEVAAQRWLDSGPTLEEEPFTKFARLVRTMKANWASDLAAAEGNSGPSATTIAEPFLDNNAEGMAMPFFPSDESETWIAGLFDINWDL
ncbi:hypothetical protein VTI28DRAFT_8804 [Corynascus sepedonium]